MENKKKRLSGKVLALLLMLTLISCCFLGATFAKYTSAKTGTSSVGVAYWEVDGISENSTSTNAFTLTAENLSPNTDGTSNQVASGVYTITNNSEVKANVSMTIGDTEFTVKSGVPYGLDHVATDTATDPAAAGLLKTVGGTNYYLTKALLNKVFTVTYYVSTADNAPDATGTEGWTVWNGSAKDLAAEGGKLHIKTVMVWKTLISTDVADTGYVWADGDGDLIDTEIGMYIESVAKTVELTAVQAIVNA